MNTKEVIQLCTKSVSRLPDGLQVIMRRLVYQRYVPRILKIGCFCFIAILLSLIAGFAGSSFWQDFIFIMPFILFPLVVGLLNDILQYVMDFRQITSGSDITVKTLDSDCIFEGYADHLVSNDTDMGRIQTYTFSLMDENSERKVTIGRKNPHTYVQRPMQTGDNCRIYAVNNKLLFFTTI